MIASRGPALLLLLAMPLTFAGAAEFSGPSALGVERFETPKGRLFAKDYKIELLPSGRASRLVSSSIFEGFSPFEYDASKGRVENWPGKFVRDDKFHSYLEVIGKHGRIQFHEEHGEGYYSRWLEFFPTQLPLDKLVRREIAVHLELGKSYKVYIYSLHTGEAMTIQVRDGLVKRIFWTAD